jgi:hypothetical protein
VWFAATRLTRHGASTAEAQASQINVVSGIPVERERKVKNTNVLVRAMIGDDERQKRARAAEFAAAEFVAIALPSLCELVWVLSQGYEIAFDEIADAVRRLTNGRQRSCKPSSCRSRACCAAGCWWRLC